MTTHQRSVSGTNLGLENTRRNPPKQNAVAANKSKAWGMLLGAVMVFIFGLIAYRLFPRSARAVGETALAAPLLNLGVGLLALIATPILAIIAFVTVIGIPTGGALLILFGMACLLATFLAFWQTGVYLMWLVKSRQAAELKPDFSWLTFAVGIAGLAIIGLIPFFGPLIKFILFLISLGAIIQRLMALSRAEQAK